MLCKPCEIFILYICTSATLYYEPSTGWQILFWWMHATIFCKCNSLLFHLRTELPLTRHRRRLHRGSRKNAPVSTTQPGQKYLFALILFALATISALLSCQKWWRLLLSEVFSQLKIHNYAFAAWALPWIPLGVYRDSWLAGEGNTAASSPPSFMPLASQFPVSGASTLGALTLNTALVLI